MLKIDWCDKDAVIAYAKRLGKGLTVFKSPDRSNYNITFTGHDERYQGCEIVYQT